MKEYNIDKAIRRVPDFPKKGILFYDFTSLLTNPEAFGYILGCMKEEYSNKNIDGIVAVESRGFLFGAPLALDMKVPLILARKKGKLPCETIAESYELEYGQDTLEMHVEDVKKGMNLLVVDDLIGTGGTLKAVANLIERLGASVAGIFTVIGLPFLNYNKNVGDYQVKTLIEYDSE